jgi:hypothetical protein
MNMAAEVVIEAPDDRDEEEEIPPPSEPEARETESTAGQCEAWRYWLNGGEW